MKGRVQKINRLLLLIVGFALGVSPLQAQTLLTDTSPAGAENFVVPAGVTCIRVQLWGGGGGGGGQSLGSNGAGGGGGGGGYSEGYVTVVPGATISYTVGAAGAGGAGANAGTAGGNTTWNGGSGVATGLTATGGAGGAKGGKASTGGAGGTGSQGGSVTYTVSYAGGDGGATVNANKAGGGGGGGSGAPIGSGNSGNASTSSTGAAGGAAAAGGGNGGDGGNQDTDGVAGTAPGGGGGGAGSKGTANRNGGNGGAGKVLITQASPSCPASTTVSSALAQSVCQGSAATALTATSSLSGGCGAPTVLYQWYSTTVNNNTVAGATAIPGATTNTYTPPSAVMGTTYYFCVAYATNNGCGQTATTQSLASNQVKVDIVNATPPTASNAGGNQTICIGSSTVLAANTPAVGTGTWSVVSGPSTSTSQFSNINSPTATFTPSGVAVTGSVFTLRWTISAGSCTAPSSTTMTVTVNCGGGCPACPAPYTQPTVGIQGEYVGACLVSTCSGLYTDDGGTAANYSANINAIYRVFCPTNAGQCMQATFTSFDVEPAGIFYYDYLTVGNGPTQNSTVFTTAPANGTGRIFGTPAVPFSYTSTHQSGCLTMRFTSDGSTQRPGWQATLACVPCAGGPTGTDNSDCNNATRVCANVSNPSNAKGPGIDAEGCSGSFCPAGGENHANWYKVKIATAGTFGFNIVPTTATDDYDYSIYGPNLTCTTLGNPLRCSDSAITGTTGIGGGDTDGGSFGSGGAAAPNTENVQGDGITPFLNVTAGQEYLILVDEWTPTGAGFNLNFTGTATLDCTILPVELSTFEAKYVSKDKGTDLFWVTSSERDCDYFSIEKSYNGQSFFEIGKTKAMGNTSFETQYYYFDKDPIFGMNYYRLKTIDFNGSAEYSEVKAVNVIPENMEDIMLYPNPAQQFCEMVYACPKNETVYLKIYDMKGNLLLSKSIESGNGINYETIDLAAYSKGVYMVNLTTSYKVYTQKITKE